MNLGWLWDDFGWLWMTLDDFRWLWNDFGMTLGWLLCSQIDINKCLAFCWLSNIINPVSCFWKTNMFWKTHFQHISNTLQTHKHTTHNTQHNTTQHTTHNTPHTPTHTPLLPQQFCLFWRIRCTPPGRF